MKQTTGTPMGQSQGQGQGASSTADQREALKQSQRKAAQPQPENFKDEETRDKVVEVGPDMTGDPIKGIDPDDDQSRR